MRLVVLALLISTPAAADVGSAFRGNPTWKYDTVTGASLDKLRPMKKARVACRVAKLDENQHVSIRVQLACGARKFAIGFDDAGGDLVFPFSKSAAVQKLKLHGVERDVWYVEAGKRAIGFLPDRGPVLLCDAVKPYRCLRLAPPSDREAEHAAIIRLLGSSSNADPGMDMSRRRPGADLGRQLDEAKHPPTLEAQPGDPHMRATGGGSVQSKLGGPAGGPATSPPPGPPGRISLTSKAAHGDVTTLTLDVVAAKVLSAYMAGMKRCYKQVLRKHATAKGTLDVELAVGTMGSSTAIVTSFDNELTSCVQFLAKHWRFPVPKDDAGDSTVARFQLSFTLVPE